MNPSRLFRGGENNASQNSESAKKTIRSGSATGYNEEAFPSLPVPSGAFFRQDSAPPALPQSQSRDHRPVPSPKSDTALLKSLTEDLKKDLQLGGGGQDL